MNLKTPAEEIKRRVLNGESLLKFCYLGDEGSQAWDRMRGDSDFQVGNREFSVLNQMLSWLRERLSSETINLIHIGPGNGIETEPLVNRLQLDSRSRYFAVDLSSSILRDFEKKRHAFLNMKGIPYSLHEVDVEIESEVQQLFHSIRKSPNSINVVVATGEGTLLASGAVPRNLAKVLTDTDWAMFSLDAISDDPVKTCREYDQPSFREFIGRSLNVAKAHGIIPDSEGEFLPTEYDSPRHLICCRYRLEKSDREILLLETLKPQTTEQAGTFFANHSLRVAMTHQDPAGAFGIICTAK